MKQMGRNAVLELLKTDKPIDKILLEKGAGGTLDKIFALARQRGVRVQFVDRKALDRECPEGRHQGVIAFTGDYTYFDLSDLCKDGKFLVLCDGIEDVHNLGSILRVAECAGAGGVVIPALKSAQVNEAVIRISAGAAEHIRVARVPSINSAIDEIQREGYWVYALETGGEDIFEEKFEGKCALVVGGEDSGVKRLTKEKCDKILSLPLYGKVNSLNASVALGIAAYEVVRAKLGK